MAEHNIREIKRIRLIPVIKTGLPVGFVLTFVLYLVYWLFLSSLLVSLGIDPGLGGFGAALSGWFALLMLGLLVSVTVSTGGTLLLLIGALTYNAMASILGGIEVETTEVEQKAVTPRPFPGSPPGAQRAPAPPLPPIPGSQPEPPEAVEPPVTGTDPDDTVDKTNTTKPENPENS